MQWYYWIALAVIFLQLLFLFFVYRNYRYALKEYQKQRSAYRPHTLLVIPCKGLDAAFDENIASFFAQDYGNYLLWFVVAGDSDPAYERLNKLTKALSGDSKALQVRVLVAGCGKSCSQKIHNLLYCYEKRPADVEVLAFADSDTCIQPDWLSHIVYPLRKTENGAASGYRWFVPAQNNSATIALSAANAKIVQLLGNSRFNHAWGGSMAIRTDVFKKIGLERIWPTALSDDLCLTYAVKKAGMKIAFVPACLSASYEKMGWRQLFEFGRRQFLITRISAAGLWWFGLLASLYSVLGLWATAVLAVYAVNIQAEHLLLYTLVPIVFFAGQFSRAVLRQRMAFRLLKKDRSKIRLAAAADILLFWLWSVLMLVSIVSSAFGRTIRWRGIRYKMLGPAETIVLDR